MTREAMAGVRVQGRPNGTIEAVNGRFSGFPLFEAAAAALAGALKAADTRVVYLVTPRYGEINNEPERLLAALRRAGSPRRNAILICDLSNEGVPFTPALVQTLEALKAGWPGRLGLVLVQTSVAYQAAARRFELPLPMAFSSYHHHAMVFLRTCVAEDYVAKGMALLDRPAPLKAYLCLNNTPRLHRLLAMRFLARRLPDDYLATFAGFDRSKLDWRHILQANQKHFPRVGDLDALVEEVQALGVSGLTNPDLPLHWLTHGVEPDTYEKTFASLVTETEMTSGGVRRYTEKILKPLVMAHPVIVAGNPGTLALIEELGFDVLRDVVDQGYDEIMKPQRRFDAMKRAALRLAGVDRPAFLRSHRDRLGRNVEQFDGRLLARMEERFTQEMAAAIRDLLPAMTA